MANLLTELQVKEGRGLYSTVLTKEVSPFMSDILFGIDPNNPRTSLNFKGIMLQRTTSKDGKSIEWRLISTPNKATTLAAASTAGNTTITVVDGSLFSVADDISIDTGSKKERKLVVAIAWNVLTLDSSVAAHDAGVPVKVVTHAKGKWVVSNKVQGAWSDTTESNYFQIFDATLEIDTDILNSHILTAAGGINKGISDSLNNSNVDTSINEYLKLEFVRIFGYDILQDVERAFWEGVKKEATIGGTVYRYTGWFEQYKTEEDTKDASTDFNSDKEFFDYIVKILYNTENEGAKIKAGSPIIVCNNAFYRKFLTLQPNAVQYTEEKEQSGYKMSKIFINSKTYEVHYSPALDELVDNAETDGLVYVFPKDAVAAKTQQFTGLDVMGNGLKATTKWAPTDVKIVADVNNEANGDIFKFYFYMKLWFVFGAYTAGTPVNVYRKINISNLS